jgi:sporulation protein YlmC with PRC-barrel domain
MNDITTLNSTTTDSTRSYLIDSNRVEGTEVFDRDGKHIGTVKRLVIEKVSGRVAYTIVSFGGFLGMGSDTYTIPWNALSYDVRLGGFTTDITPDRLKEAPEFSRNADDGDYFTDRARESTLNDYYGSRYYWND